MGKVKAYHTGRMYGLPGDRELLKCAICGEDDRNKLQVEHLGLAAGMVGEDFSFCSACWNSEELGEKILNLIGFSGSLKLDDEYLEFEEEI
jgi:hypothetical protein